jgi:feruloyl esterase
MNLTRIVTVAALAPLAAVLLGACSPIEGDRSRMALTSAPLADAARRCVAMAPWTAERLRVTRAVWVDAGEQRVQDPRTGQPVGEPLPAHCLVQARLDERLGVDGERYHTDVELRLPVNGQRRLLMQGSEVGAGLQAAVGRNTGAHGWIDNGLQRGFTTVSTNGGVPAPTPLFGLDPQARIEQAWRAHWRAATAARGLFERYHGQPPLRSYFIGCGDGGRQGMMFSQRFPDLFDGVVAQAPAMRAGQGAAVATAWTLQRLLAVAPVDGQGRRQLPAAFSEAQLQRVAREIVDRCDGADGLDDGIVAETALCRINPRRLLCPAAGDACLSPEQADALAAVMAGPLGREGRRLGVGWPWDPGIAAAGWRDWNLGGGGSSPAVARHLEHTSRVLGFVWSTPADPTLSLLNFDFDRDPLRLLTAQRLNGTADDVLLKPFQQRGGKLLLIHGMADPVHSALDTVDYQQRVDAAHGPVAASRFVRTFLVPGMNHCEGGPTTDAFDGLGAIVDWVERGRAPQTLLAQGTAERPGTRRPLCPHPKITRYAGGDPQDAGSFECR